MTIFEGNSYDTVEEKSLFDLLERVKAITETVGEYHKAGYLHLDIKPENILTIPQTRQFVMLFDFDSVIRKEEIPSAAISYSQDWAAPELNSGKRNLFCDATDLYSIGEILFYKLFKRHSYLSEQRSFSHYQFDFNSSMLKNVNPKVAALLTDIFHHTLCGSVKGRYQSAAELIDVLNKIIALADPKEPVLLTSMVIPDSYFVGRQRELDEMQQIIQTSHRLILSGLGGIGKSELLRNYANQHKTEYDYVVYITYSKDILTSFNDEINVTITNIYPYKAESPEGFFYRKLSILKRLIDKARTLIIIDNLDLNPDDYRYLHDIININCDLLCSSRYDRWDFASVKRVENIEDTHTLCEMFCHWYEDAIDDNAQISAIEEIIKYINGHTLSLKLIARQTFEGFFLPTEKLAALKRHGIAADETEISTYKDGLSLGNKTAIDHIGFLFDISKLDELDKTILANIALLPIIGASAKTFLKLCSSASINKLNDLIHEGWVERTSGTIRMHPVIKEVVLRKLHYSFKDNVELSDSIINFFMEQESLPALERKELLNISKSIIFDLIKYSLESQPLFNFAKDELWIEEGLFAKKDYEDLLDSLDKLAERFFYENEELCCDLILQRAQFYWYFDDLQKALNAINKAFLSFPSVINSSPIKSLECLKLKGSIYSDMGDSDSALACFEKAKSFLNDIDDEDKDKIILKRNLYEEIGRANFDICCYSKSLKAYKYVLETFTDELSDLDKKYKITCLHDIGNAYYHLYDTDNAVCYLRDALDLGYTIYGGDHPSNNRTRKLLYSIELESGCDNALLNNIEDLLQSDLDYYGEYHSYVASDYGFLASAYKETEDFKKALDCSKKQLSLFMTIKGEQHPSTISAIIKLADSYTNTGDFSKALELLDKARTLNEKLEIPDIENTTDEAFYRALLYHKMNRHEEALKQKRIALSINASLGRPDNAVRELDVIKEQDS